MRLSRKVSKWLHIHDAEFGSHADHSARRRRRKRRIHDIQLRRLFEYLKGTVGVSLVSRVQRDKPIEFLIWTDADLNGDVSDSKSTSGLWIELRSSNGDVWPITWNSKRQGGSAYATCESEVIALNTGIREEGIALHGL
eukprot:6481210-Amphidinium_carterae.1